MKQSSFGIALGLVLSFVAAGCTKTEVGWGPKRQVIEILQPDKVLEGGKLKYTVGPGDKLEVIRRKICRGGYGICLEVRNVKTGVIGYVRAEDMERRHRISKEY